MKSDYYPILDNRRSIDVDLYTGLKSYISEIVRTTYCKECRSGFDNSCDIQFPQTQLPDGALHQLRLVVVHSYRKDSYELTKSSREIIKSKPTITESGKPIDFDKLRPQSKKPLPALPPSEVPSNDLMTFDRYEKWTNSVAIYAGRSHFAGLIYAALGLTGESGEYADKVKKMIRKGDIVWDGCTVEQISETDRDHLIDELGDVQWYIARSAKELGVTLDYIARRNIIKLDGRKQRDTIHGQGDER